MESGFATVCDFELEMGPDDPHVVGARPVVGWSSDDPMVEWYREWAESPELWLPTGTWLVRAWTLFSVGPGCAVEPVPLSGAVVLRIIDGDATATPAP